MKYNEQKPKNEDHALMVAVISAFRSINPSYTNAHSWYTEQAPHSIKSPLGSRTIKSKYYLPIFGSVFASAFALVMILTSHTNTISNNIISLKSTSSETLEVATFTMTSDTQVAELKEDKRLLAKIDAQSKASSRTQADEAFTESLNVETSLQDLFQ